MPSLSFSTAILRGGAGQQGGHTRVSARQDWTRNRLGALSLQGGWTASALESSLCSAIAGHCCCDAGHPGAAAGRQTHSSSPCILSNSSRS